MRFKKITAILGSLAFVGLTISSAAAVYPTSYVDNGALGTAIVYGSGSAPSDLVAVHSINSDLKPLIDWNDTTWAMDNDEGSNVVSSSDFSDSLGVTEDEISLGDSILDNSKINSPIFDNKIPTLLDWKISWDDGTEDKSYDVHEEILIGSNTMEVLTNLEDKELNSKVILTNDEGLTYKYVFDDELDISAINTIDADELYLTILGQEYEILDMEPNSITVSISDEKIVKVGESVIVDGVTFKVNDVYEEHVEINGVLVEEGHRKVISGMEVYVDTIAYHSSTSLSTSKVILNIGKDIEQTFEDGEEYFGDETWEWSIEDPGKEGGYVGVKYVRKSISYDEDDIEDNAIEIGQAYVFPENYAGVFFNGLTEVTYNDFELSFDNEKLYNSPTLENGSKRDLVILEGEKDDSFKIGNFETDSLYFYYDGNSVSDNVEVFFKDINGDVDDEHEGRIQFKEFFSFDSSQKDIATLIVDDTEIEVKWDNMALTLTNSEGVDIKIPLSISSDKEFDGLGDFEEDAESGDLVVNGKSIGTREEDVMDNYGNIIENPENNAENDNVLFSVPSEQVYASVSVLGQGKEVLENTLPDGSSTNSTNSTNSTVVTPQVTPIVDVMYVLDTEIESVKDRNLIVVGGSCINKVAAKLLGVPEKTCGNDFTTLLGVGEGQFILQEYASPYTAGKVAMLIAGYSAADTTAGVNQLISQ